MSIDSGDIEEGEGEGEEAADVEVEGEEEGVDDGEGVGEEDDGDNVEKTEWSDELLMELSKHGEPTYIVCTLRLYIFVQLWNYIKKLKGSFFYSDRYVWVLESRS